MRHIGIPADHGGLELYMQLAAALKTTANATRFRTQVP